jgi:hypothetical protein
MDSINLDPGPLCSTLLCPAGGIPLKGWPARGTGDLRLSSNPSDPLCSKPIEFIPQVRYKCIVKQPSFVRVVQMKSWPPKIVNRKQTLPRSHRCSLAQLGSGHCSQLQWPYLFSINKAAPHLPARHFSCPVYSTDLTVANLWSHDHPHLPPFLCSHLLPVVDQTPSPNPS